MPSLLLDQQADSTRYTEGHHTDIAASIESLLQPSAEGQVLFGPHGDVLRESQIKALQELLKYIRSGGDVGHIVQPGGTGKTWEGIVLAQALARLELNTLFITFSQHSIDDFSGKAEHLSPELDISKVYQYEKQVSMLTFATYISALRLVGAELGDTDIDLSRFRIDPHHFDLRR